ncbi:trichohyalin-like isoform X2 [Chelmon rostratus]|uniref:trichohyalin-like isoform X2 n=1 Tax=Chelmon rostratus TaxID=109905 RepID=UPI001BE5D20F|nr:trichohyalin-like isoform X2 [Chelmon rostratus]
MTFPVDLLADVSQAELEQVAHDYMHDLLFSNPDNPEHLTLSDSTQVTISSTSVGLVPLYGSSDKEKILALFSPSDPLTAVALYLLGQWWTVDDILKTADIARDGAVEVQTVGERIVLYILNRVIYRAKEMSSAELPFLCHGENDYAKILWNNGEAVGFYSAKPSGSLCSSYSTRRYQLPVMDSLFVRKCQRGKGFGLQMLKDFVLSFKEDNLGLRYPLTKSMYKVCEKYLSQYPGDTDLLWEVESIGGPNQRTNISSKIQAMGLSVSKSLSFTEESLVITEVTEKDVVMEAVTTQIKETESMECTVEIVEEVTVLRATKEAELPVAARGRSGGSNRMNTGEKITEDKSEKVIRIEDIEAETPREEQVSAQQKTEVHVSELVQTEVVFSVAHEGNEENVADAASKEEAAMMSDKPATVLVTQELEEVDVTSAPTPEEPQVDDDVMQDLNATSHDSGITVENVASEIEEAEEECQVEDTAVLVVSEEVLEVHKEAETLNKMEEGTQIEHADEKSEEIVPQHELSLSTHATSQDGEAGKTGRTVVKAIKTIQSETPRRRSERHRKPEEGAKEETPAQDGRRVLRRRTVTSTPTPKRKYTRNTQRVYEELEKEVDEMAEEDEVATDEIVEEFEEEEEKQHLEDEQLPSEEETAKQEEPEAEDTALRENSAETLTEEKVTEESEKEQKGEEVMQDKQEVSDDEIEEPPVVQKRALRGRRKVTPKPTKQSEIHQKQEEEHTDDAGLGAGDSTSEEKADEKAADKEMGEQHKAGQEVTDEKTEDELSIPEPEGGALLPEVNVEECMEVQEDKETGGETEEVSVMKADKEEEADDMIREPDSVAATSTEIPDESQDQAVLPMAEDPQEKDTGSEISKLQEATVVLVDLKTTCDDVSMKEAEETPADGECAAPEGEQVELIAEEEKDVSSCVAEEQTPEPEMLVLEEEDGGKQENSTEKSVDAAAEEETVEMEELEADSCDKEKEESANVEGEKGEAEEVPFIETRVLRSGRKMRRLMRQEEDNIDEVITEKKVDKAETGTVEVEGEVDAVAKDAVTVTVSVEESAVSEICADTKQDISVVDDAEENPPSVESDEAMSLEEEEAVVKTRALRRGPKTVTATPRHKKTRGRKQVSEHEAEDSEEEEPAVTTRTLRRGRMSASATPTGKPRQTRKQIQEQEQKGAEESESVEETGEEEEAVKEAVVEKTDKEREEQTEEKRKEEEDASEREESLEPEIDVEEGKAVVEEDAVEEQSEATSKTFAEREEEASGEECDEGKPAMGGEEVELPPVAVTRSLRSGGKTPRAPPKSRRGRRNRTQLQKTEEGAQESAEEAEVEEEEAGLVSTEEPPKEGDEGKASGEDEMEVEKEEAVTVEMERGVSEEGTMTVTEEEENTAGVTAAEDDLVQEGETETPPPKPATDSAILTPSEPEAAASAEEQQSEKMVPQLSDLQRVTVVLVDLKKTHHEVLEETAAVEEDVSIEKTATEVEEEQSQETVKEEETIAEEDVPGSPVGIEKTEPDSVAVEEEGMEEKVEDAVTIQGTGEGKGEETAEEDEAKGVDEQKEEEEEEPTTETRTRTRRKQVVKATLRRKMARGRQKKGEEEKEESSENTEEEPAVQVRVLRRGRKSIPVGQRCTTKATHKQLQEEVEEADSGADEADALEEGQAGSTETPADEDAEAPTGQSADEGKISDDTEEAATTQTTVEGEQSASTSAAGESAQETLLTAKDDEAKDVSEEDEAPVIETRVLRKGRRSAASTPRRKSKRARMQCETEEEEEDQATPAEEMQVEETKAVPDEAKEKEEDQDEKIEEAAAQEGEAAEPDVVAEESLTELQTVEEEPSAVSETPAGGGTAETPNTDDGEVPDEEEAPVVETRVLRSGGKAVKATPRSKSTKSQEQANEPEGAVVEDSADTDEPAGGTRAPRKGRRSASATPSRKSKRARRQCETEEDGEEEPTPAEETEGEEEETAVDETRADTVKVEETLSAEEEETTVLGTSTAATQVGSDSAVAEDELLVEDESVVREEEAVTTRTLSSKTKTSHATPPRRSRRLTDQEDVESRQQQYEEPEEVHQVTDESPENGELNAEEEAETDEAPPAGQEAGSPAEVTAEDQAQEAADLTGDRVDEPVEPAGEEPATEEMESPEEEPSESKEEETVKSSVAEGRSLRRRAKAVVDKAEEIQNPSRRSVRKRPRVDYKEDVEEDEGVESEAATDKEEEDGVKSDEDRVNIKAENSADEPELKGAVVSTSENGTLLTLALDSDEEVQTAGLSQEDEEDEQNMSEEEAEPVVIGRRVLRGRSIPSLVITPLSKSRRRSARLPKPEESFSEEEKSPETAQRRSPRKRRGTEVTPTRKSKRHSRV